MTKVVKNKPAKSFPRSAPLSASKKAAVFNNGGGTKKRK
jgi:hypothetical protein